MRADYASEQSARLSAIGLSACRCGEDLAGECAKCEPSLLCVANMTDERIASVLADAIAREDVELLDWCETALKQIVSPAMKVRAKEHIVALLKREAA